jgi:hypothetical protein
MRIDAHTHLDLYQRPDLLATAIGQINEQAILTQAHSVVTTEKFRSKIRIFYASKRRRLALHYNYPQQWGGTLQIDH